MNSAELIMQYDWQTKAEARRAIFRYIEIWHNRKRRHSTLGTAVAHGRASQLALLMYVYTGAVYNLAWRTHWQESGQHVVIHSFKPRGTEDIFNGVRSKAARKICLEMIWSVAVRKLQLIDYAARLNDLAFPLRNGLEALKRDRLGQHAIRINEQYRVCFVWAGDGARDVEITDH